MFKPHYVCLEKYTFQKQLILVSILFCLFIFALLSVVFVVVFSGIM